MRNVVREHLFEDSLAALIPDAIAADDFVAASEWLLARDPEIGVAVRGGSPVWALPLPPINGQQVALYYTFDETTVNLLAVEIVRPPAQ